MQIINRSSQHTLWAFFDSGDPMAATPFGGPSQVVPLESKATKTINTGGTVQIKLFTTLTVLVSLPGRSGEEEALMDLVSHLPPYPVINATRNNTFDNSLMVVFTGSSLVKLDDKYRALVGLNADPPSPDTPSVSVELGKVVAAVLTLGQALIKHAWADESTKWIEEGVFEVAMALIDIFSPKEESHLLSLDEIRSTVQDVIDQNEARLLTPELFDAAAWLDKWVEKSASLAEGKADLKTVKLTDYDQKEFLRELKELHDGTTPFKSSMAKLRDNREIRKHVIPTYLLGALLHLHFELLSLKVKQQTTPLDKADVNALLNTASTYARTVPQLEEDYVALCHDLARQYPLGPALEEAGKPEPELLIPLGPQPPEPIEGNALAKGALTKWLSGDRLLISKTGEKLNKFIEDVKKMSATPK